MNATKDEYSSHITDIGETTLDFLSKSGMCGWPTILGILGIMVINPDSHQWLSKSRIDLLPKPDLGDTVHWYKIKNDLKSNIRRSIPIGLLNGVNMFTTKDIPELINETLDIHVSKTSVYFTTQTGTKVCSKSESNLNNYKSIDVGIVLDVISKNDFDYILTNSVIYRINNKTYTDPTIIFENHGVLNAFCLADSVIIVACSDGGYKISNIENNPSSSKIKRETGVYTPTTSESGGNGGQQGQGSGTGTNMIYDNGVPVGACEYCWYDGSKFYIGDSLTCGSFDPSASSYVTEYVEGNTHTPYLNGVNRSHNGILYGEKTVIVETDNQGQTQPQTQTTSTKTGVLYGDSLYDVTGVKSVLDLDNVVLFGTDSGIKVFTKNTVDGMYGPQELYLTLAGITGSIKCMCSLYGTVFVVGQNAKYRSFDSEEDDNKLRFVVFGTDYDIDVETDETDAKEVKLNLLDLFNLGSVNSKVFDSRLSKANKKPAKYAIGIYDSKPKVFNLYGHDNRNAPAVELDKCMKAFDMEI